jgi:hypothetical protein
MKQLRYAFLALMTLALFSLNAQQMISIRVSGTTIKVSGGAANPSGGGGTGGGSGPNLAIQGFGKDAQGASAGDPVITVNTLSGGTGAGSLYWALNTATGGTGSATSHKKIVFSVDGTISSNLFTLNTLSFVTIDGTGHNVVITAPANDGLSFEGSGCHHNIVKNLHFANCGGADGANAVDGAHDIVFMNCSFYGNGDGNIDVGVNCSKITIQYCLIGNHFSPAPGDDGTGGMLITSIEVSAHHNLFNVKSDEEGERCPLIHGNYSNAFADVRFNLVYNFGRSLSTGSGFGTGVGYGTGFGDCPSCYARANIVNNYYYTPSSDAAPDGIEVNAGLPGAECYVSGNISGNGFNFNTQSNHAEWAISSQYQVETELTCLAVQNVLLYAGPDTKNSDDNTIISGVTQLGSCAFNNNPPRIIGYPNWLPTTEVTEKEGAFSFVYDAILPTDIINRRKKKNKPLV